ARRSCAAARWPGAGPRLPTAARTQRGRALRAVQLPVGWGCHVAGRAGPRGHLLRRNPASPAARQLSAAGGHARQPRPGALALRAALRPRPHRARASRGRAAARQRAGRSIGPGQGIIFGQPQPRDSHAHEWGAGHGPPAHQNQPRYRPARAAAHHSGLGRALALGA
nr:hypothetical protein [Tanacetum cinerariifolium]